MTQRTVLTRELREIRAQLLELASLAERAVQRALDALVTRDFDLAQQVIDDDGSIDRLRFDIEQRCYELMATQQPAASVGCGFTRSGLPAGLHVIGRMFDDASLLRACHAYEQAAEWHRQRPEGF